VVEQGVSADDLISVVEVRVAACQLSHFLTNKLRRACCHECDPHYTGDRFREVSIATS
jgi:hypothetical protein